MKKVKFEFRGVVDFKIRFCSGEMEIEVPDDVENVEEYIKNSKEYREAFDGEVEYINKELQGCDLIYEEKETNSELDFWED